jgi:hypothetical protein
VVLYSGARFRFAKFPISELCCPVHPQNLNHLLQWGIANSDVQAAPVDPVKSREHLQVRQVCPLPLRASRSFVADPESNHGFASIGRKEDAVRFAPFPAVHLTFARRAAVAILNDEASEVGLSSWSHNQSETPVSSKTS